MFRNLSEVARIESALTYTSGTADRNGLAIDTAGFDGVLFIVTFAVIAAGAVTDIFVEQDTLTGFDDDSQALLGSSQTIADDDDDGIFYVDIFRPRDRFVRLVVNKDASNATAESALAFLYRGQSFPVSHGSSVAGERFSSPAEGAK